MASHDPDCKRCPDNRAASISRDRKSCSHIAPVRAPLDQCRFSRDITDPCAILIPFACMGPCTRWVRAFAITSCSRPGSPIVVHSSRSAPLSGCNQLPCFTDRGIDRGCPIFALSAAFNDRKIVLHRGNARYLACDRGRVFNVFLTGDFTG